MLVTAITLVAPSVKPSLQGIEPRTHPWQLLTAAFVHGWEGFPALLHLALNSFLILECGRPCERLLGPVGFALLTLAAIGANAIALSLTPGANGASLFIWSWCAPLTVAWLKAKPTTNAKRRVANVLLLMLVVIMPLMALLPYLFGFQGNPLNSFLMANLFHLVALGTGILFAAITFPYLRRRLETQRQSPDQRPHPSE